MPTRALGKDKVEMVNSVSTTKVNCLLKDCDPDVTVAVNIYVPAVVGVPLIVPGALHINVELQGTADNERPVGNTPAVANQEYDESPP